MDERNISMLTQGVFFPHRVSSFRATWEVVQIQVVSSRLLQVQKIRKKDQCVPYNINMIDPNGHQ
jgi:hypothetical protein